MSEKECLSSIVEHLGFCHFSTLTTCCKYINKNKNKKPYCKSLLQMISLW